MMISWNWEGVWALGTAAHRPPPGWTQYSYVVFASARWGNTETWQDKAASKRMIDGMST